jgi:hypothetical protein
VPQSTLTISSDAGESHTPRDAVTYGIGATVQMAALGVRS